MGYAKLQLRGDTAANWTAANPVLADRELALETDTGQFKIGDGVTAWTSLAYGGLPGPGVPSGGTVGQVLVKASGTDYDTDWGAAADLPISDATQAALDDKADLVGGVVPSSQMPAIAITQFLGEVASESAMLALDGEMGDWCIRTDSPVATWIITGSDPTSLGSWTKVSVPVAPVSTVNGQTGTVVLGKGDVGLSNVDNTADTAKPVSTLQQAALDAKLNSAAVSAFGLTLVDDADAATARGTLGVAATEVLQNSKSAAYTLVLADSAKHILHPSADTTARTFTIPANSSVAYPIGTALTFVNQNGAGVVTIAITTDTMRLAGAGTTGSRTLAANGVATAIKLTSTEWIISGVGLT